MSNEEIIQNYVDGLVINGSFNNLENMIDNIDDLMIELIDQKWAIEDHLLDPLIDKMNNVLNNLNKTGTLYKGDDYGEKNLEEWAWYKNSGINTIYYYDDNTFYVDGDKRSTFSAGKYLLIKYSNKSIPRRVSSVKLSGSYTYVHLSTDPEDDLWDNPYYDKNKASYPTCVNPNIASSKCDCYVLTEKPYTTTTSTSTTTTQHQIVPGVFKIVVDMSKIYDELEEFPVLINLTNTSGINGLNTTEIFNELGSNWRKIYIQDSYPFNTGSDLSIEMDFWEPENNRANLYTRIRKVRNSGYFQTFYLYFDSSLDNNPKIGCKYDINCSSTEISAAFSVWNKSGYLSVFHFSDDPSNITDLNKLHTSSSNNITAKIESYNDISELYRKYEYPSYSFNLKNSSYISETYDYAPQYYNWTIEARWKSTRTDTFDIFYCGNSNAGLNTIRHIEDEGTAYYTYLVWDGFRDENYFYYNGLSYNDFVYTAATYNNTDYFKRIYLNGSLNDEVYYPRTNSYNKDFTLVSESSRIDSYISISELRISPVDRSSAWIKAVSYDLNDNLLYYYHVYE